MMDNSDCTDKVFNGTNTSTIENEQILCLPEWNEAVSSDSISVDRFDNSIFADTFNE